MMAIEQNRMSLSSFSLKTFSLSFWKLEPETCLLMWLFCSISGSHRIKNFNFRQQNFGFEFLDCKYRETYWNVQVSNIWPWFRAFVEVNFSKESHLSETFLS